MEHAQIRENYSLRNCNTFGIEANARYYAEFASTEELESLLQEPPVRDAGKLLVLGGGSNILFTGDVDGTVLRNNIGGIDTVGEDAEFVYVRAGAGVNWHQFVLHCLAQGYAGVENLSLIPGSVGASPMQNIGAYGVEIKDVFHELEALHIAHRARRTFDAEACAFGYRESVFKNKYKGQYIITSVTYQLRKQPVFHTEYGAIRQELEAMGVTELSIGAIAQAVINIRTSKLPDWHETGNAGSFFKNPQVTLDKYAELKTAYPSIPAYPQESGMKLAAGWLIEQCGWKGYREGDAGCYPKQALVLVNYGKATGGEIFALSEKIIGSVQDKFGVLLEREVNIV
ncbi:MAG: UDP-N-acetylmuramate dehydrogenase [Chitinophagaceae bacterium]|nr:MAG: UDP-N-acetylmuramate dehydrogenase [Chitinophagaceae bacterium]